jgi:hypothetical protein
VAGVAFALPAPPGGARGRAVVLDSGGEIAEIYEGSNRAALR